MISLFISLSSLLFSFLLFCSLLFSSLLFSSLTFQLEVTTDAWPGVNCTDKWIGEVRNEKGCSEREWKENRGKERRRRKRGEREEKESRRRREGEENEKEKENERRGEERVSANQQLYRFGKRTKTTCKDNSIDSRYLACSPSLTSSLSSPPLHSPTLLLFYSVASLSLSFLWPLCCSPSLSILTPHSRVRTPMDHVESRQASFTTMFQSWLP